MNAEITLEPKPLRPRRVSLAVLLSLFGAGIGHLYAGRGRRGAILMALALGYVPAVYVLSFLPPSDAILYTLVGIVLLEIGVVLFTLVDAALVAREAPRPYRARPYNSAALYVGLIVLCLTWGLMGTAFLRERAFEVYSIPTASMEPTLTRGDRILVNKFQTADVQRGDLVVFRAPDSGGNVYVKRVVGLPGEHVQVKDNDVEVPAGHVYLLGDNRRNSRDSRFFGPVPLGDILGVAQYLYSSRDGELLFRRIR